MAHPLSGAAPGVIASVIARGGLPSNPLDMLSISGAVAARSPFSAVERLLTDRRLPKLKDLPAPIFILGHWRSGTTHLYNIMCKSDAFSYVPPVATGLPWDLFGLARIFRPLLERALPDHRYIDNIPVNPDSPQEDEIAIANMSELSFYHAIYFPRAFDDLLNRGLFFDGCKPREIRRWGERFTYLMRRLSTLQEHKPLLIKNPVYTARAAMLQQIFPNAKFVHIHRNPYDVFVSMQNFYKKLLAEFALQGYAHVDIDETIFAVYERMMFALERDLAEIPPERLVELRYDELDADPLGAVEAVYDGLEIPGFSYAQPKFDAYLKSIQSFEKNKFQYSEETANRVEARLRYFIDKWGYERPGAASSGAASSNTSSSGAPAGSPTSQAGSTFANGAASPRVN
ncbi:MAG: sulfotransferase [Pseudomonadota bacterium]